MVGHGLPLVPPATAFRDARLVAARGAGLAVPAAEITSGTLERLVSDPHLQRASQEVAAEIAAMPAPIDLVEPLLDAAR